MLSVLFKGDIFFKEPDLPVHLDPCKTVSSQFLEKLNVFPLTSFNERSQDLDFSSTFQFQHSIHNFLGGLGTDFKAALGAVRLPCSRKKHTQIIVYFRYCSHSGTWVATGRALFNAYGWRQPFNGIHIGLVHLFQELPGVGGKRFHISTLSFGVYGIKSQ